jgi:hypothetical protein
VKFREILVGLGFLGARVRKMVNALRARAFRETKNVLELCLDF